MTFGLYPTDNRDMPAANLTKREELAMRLYLADPRRNERFSVELADRLFDALETPVELHDQEEHA